MSRLAHYRRLALADPAALARERDVPYVNPDPGGEVQQAMHYELPEKMPEILRDATGVEDVEMVGAEGLLAWGLDRMVNRLQGEEFEVRVSGRWFCAGWIELFTSF